MFSKIVVQSAIGSDPAMQSHMQSCGILLLGDTIVMRMPGGDLRLYEALPADRFNAIPGVPWKSGENWGCGREAFGNLAETLEWDAEFTESVQQYVRTAIPRLTPEEAAQQLMKMSDVEWVTEEICGLLLLRAMGLPVGMLMK